jgi:YidC/Oxa1 family membrane protein insertase
MTTLIPSPAPPSARSRATSPSDDLSRPSRASRPRPSRPAPALTHETRVFAGAKEWETIRDYQRQGIDRFVDSIDWGWFFFLTKPMFWLLHHLHMLIGNMGWAIIALTLVIKALVLPLAWKSYASMAG